MLSQKFGDDGSRNTGFGKFARYIQPWRDDGGLDRVQHVEARFQIAKAVPLVIGLESPLFTRTHAFVCDRLRAPHLKPPVFAPFVIDLAHRTAEVECLQNRLFDQRCAAGWLHHRGGNVARGDDRVLR